MANRILAQDAMDWLDVAKTFGFSGLVALLLLGLVYKLGRLLIEKVAVPIVAKFVEGISEQTKIMQAILENMTEMNLRLKRLEESEQRRNERAH